MAPIVVKVGQTFSVTVTDASDTIARADVTVNKMTDLGSSYFNPASWDMAGTDVREQYTEHATKGRFVLFTVTYAATEGDFTYSESDWTVRMPDGQEYNVGGPSSNSTDQYGQPLSSGDIHKGRRAKGVIAFDIPKTHGVLVYTASTTGFQQDVEVKF
jgi:hypothetical protein